MALVVSCCFLFLPFLGTVDGLMNVSGREMGCEMIPNCVGVVVLTLVAIFVGEKERIQKKKGEKRFPLTVLLLLLLLLLQFCREFLCLTFS